MHLKRVIPCLDVDNGAVVKGTQFVDIRQVGDPAELAHFYDLAGADELVFLDITATSDHRQTLRELARKVADEIFIPFTVGGGIRTLADAQAALDAGADKIAINSAAVANPQLITDCAKVFGTQCVVVAIDARMNHAGWEVVVAGGRKATGRNVLTWVQEVAERGAGELLLTSMDCDGTTNGYDLPLINQVTERVSIPVIASGGAGKLVHLVEALEAGADAVLAASIFHNRTFSIAQAKTALAAAGIPVRLT